jgi:hypothetical protein
MQRARISEILVSACQEPRSRRRPPGTVSADRGRIAWARASGRGLGGDTEREAADACPSPLRSAPVATLGRQRGTERAHEAALGDLAPMSSYALPPDSDVSNRAFHGPPCRLSGSGAPTMSPFALRVRSPPTRGRKAAMACLAGVAAFRLAHAHRRTERRRSRARRAKREPTRRPYDLDGVTRSAEVDIGPAWSVSVYARQREGPCHHIAATPPELHRPCGRRRASHAGVPGAGAGARRGHGPGFPGRWPCRRRIIAGRSVLRLRRSCAVLMGVFGGVRDRPPSGGPR